MRAQRASSQAKPAPPCSQSRARCHEDRKVCAPRHPWQPLPQAACGRRAPVPATLPPWPAPPAAAPPGRGPCRHPGLRRSAQARRTFESWLCSALVSLVAWQLRGAAALQEICPASLSGNRSRGSPQSPGSPAARASTRTTAARSMRLSVVRAAETRRRKEAPQGSMAVASEARYRLSVGGACEEGGAERRARNRLQGKAATKSRWPRSAL